MAEPSNSSFSNIEKVTWPASNRNCDNNTLQSISREFASQSITISEIQEENELKAILPPIVVLVDRVDEGDHSGNVPVCNSNSPSTSNKMQPIESSNLRPSRAKESRRECRTSCPICLKHMTGGPSDYDHHILRTHYHIALYVCTACQKGCYSATELRVHSKNTGHIQQIAQRPHLNRNIQVFVCSFCQKAGLTKQFTSREARAEHLLQEHFKDLSYVRRNQIRNAINRQPRLTHGEKTFYRSEPLKCPFCEIDADQLRYMSDFVKHLLQDHKSESRMQSKKKKGNLNMMVRLTCPSCLQSNMKCKFSSATALAEHLIGSHHMHSSTIKTQPNQADSDTPDTASVDLQPKGRFCYKQGRCARSCVYCAYCTKQPRLWARHILNHHNISTINCPHCPDSQFVTPEDLQEHQNCDSEKLIEKHRSISLPKVIKRLKKALGATNLVCGTLESELGHTTVSGLAEPMDRAHTPCVTQYKLRIIVLDTPTHITFTIDRIGRVCSVSCPLCSTCVANIPALLTHLTPAHKHKAKPDYGPLELLCQSKEIRPRSATSIACSLCQKYNFKSKLQLAEHLLAEHDQNKNKVNVALSSEHFVKHHTDTGESMIAQRVCAVCKCMIATDQWCQHVMNHYQVKAYACEHCTRQFNKPIQLKNHQELLWTIVPKAVKELKEILQTQDNRCQSISAPFYNMAFTSVQFEDGLDVRSLVADTKHSVCVATSFELPVTINGMHVKTPFQFTARGNLAGVSCPLCVWTSMRHGPSWTDPFKELRSHLRSLPATYYELEHHRQKYAFPGRNGTATEDNVVMKHLDNAVADKDTVSEQTPKVSMTTVSAAHKNTQPTNQSPPVSVSSTGHYRNEYVRNRPDNQPAVQYPPQKLIRLTVLPTSNRTSVNVVSSGHASPNVGRTLRVTPTAHSASAAASPMCQEQPTSPLNARASQLAQPAKHSHPNILQRKHNWLSPVAVVVKKLNGNSDDTAKPDDP